MKQIKCCLCYFIHDITPRDAVTIINGQAVCKDHMGYVQGGTFTQAIDILREELEKKHGS